MKTEKVRLATGGPVSFTMRYILLAAALNLMAAGNANFGGAWVLNVERSKWVEDRKPTSAAITIEHNDPEFKYDGTVSYSTESRHYKFDGAIDGKQYPVDEFYGKGHVILKRVNDRTLESVTTSTDGKYKETARSALSRDGKTLTRSITLESPQGKKRWTEVYEKK